MSLENYLLSYRAHYQNIINRNSHAHHTFLEIYQKRIEMIDWILKRYRSIQQQEQAQNNENDFVMINKVVEELNDKKKIARNNIAKSELRDEISMYRLDEMTIEDILYEIGDFNCSDKKYLNFYKQ
jgi:gamma-glutamyl:cysteine ligase YbdK (ATP-grasp superfamily)